MSIDTMKALVCAAGLIIMGAEFIILVFLIIKYFKRTCGK